ncbi:polyamine-transporting ATPase 13A2 isoform 1-T1 [Clarias gariepinus]|uniref:cation-transporting ATPase 13A2 isoform X1 n=2 Tax=Clarias gariepinus TaxID=13013 RepID=UPI00234D8915|nr:cation-transporting ATPase 13A2 isoform X1 [Clarias gariepinus]
MHAAGSCCQLPSGSTHADPVSKYLDSGAADVHYICHMDVQGYRRVCWKVWLCYFGAICTLGMLLLLFRWRPRLGVLARCSSCPIPMADTLLLRNNYGEQFVIEVQTEEIEEGSLGFAVGELDENECRDNVKLHKDEKTLLRYYVFEGMRYAWLPKKGAFCKVSILNEGWTCADVHHHQQGLTQLEQTSRRQIFGDNIIDVPVKSYLQLLFEEVLNPFYIFQVFSIVLWMMDNYYYYAVCIFVISFISIVVSLYEIRKQSSTLRSMAQLIENVTVRRATGEEECVSSVELVPGDCVVIPAEGLHLPCDAALLAGECMVNESMLTGESVPVMKTPLPISEVKYTPESQRRHTLFCGTQIIQAKGGSHLGKGAIAVVTRTGFFTAKGDLISSILYPQPVNFRFYADAMKFLLFLGVVALIGTVYSLVMLWRSNTTWLLLVIRSLDIITIVVPPALPAALTTGTIYAQGRLKKKGVFCISPPRINVCGKISLFCFDKTGTLTEEGLDVWGVKEANKNGAGFDELVPDPRFLSPGPMLSALASCHSVALLGGQLIGDPLELKMIESTGWKLEEPTNETGTSVEFGSHRILAVMRPPASEFQPDGIAIRQSVAIVRRFPFSSSLQRMSVVTVDSLDSSARCFLKGAPEMVASHCVKESVPSQFTNTLQEFASEGFRVLALAYKKLDAQTDLSSIKRVDVEADLQFLGLLVMKNQVKPESAGAISVLRQALIRPVMVTGDNILTALNVARACGMTSSHEQTIFVHASPPSATSTALLRFHLGEGAAAVVSTQETMDILDQGLYQNNFKYHMAINGKSFAALCDYFPEELPKVLMKGTVYARMSPDQKTQLVKALQKLNYRVGMCGDGANDCGALRAADVGVSLSEAEASVASPFTSKSNNISCVPLLIREGRCSLVTSFSLFKYMALYSLIQFASVVILYTVKTNLGDFQFLFFDLALVTVLAIVMGRGGPSDYLHPQRPPACLLAIPVLSALLLHTLLLILGQVAALLFTKSQEWYVPLNSTVTGAGNLPNMENASVFALSGFQYIIMCIVVTKGYPYKKPLYHNVVFLFVLVILFAVMIWLVLVPNTFFHNFLLLYNISDMNYNMLLLALAALNLFTCYLLEVFIDKFVPDCLRTLRRNRQSKKQYKRLNAQLTETPSWPPLDQPLHPTQCSVIGVS